MEKVELGAAQSCSVINKLQSLTQQEALITRHVGNKLNLWPWLKRLPSVNKLNVVRTNGYMPVVRFSNKSTEWYKH